ncbi:VWA domain-containing protein [Streptomyces sp. NPDC088747]|uniref:VWA domain-containing protein n=1 Tax=Streptomyces sp. NPDC088747 TaxID=3365886 RepID=UPI00382FB483
MPNDDIIVATGRPAVLYVGPPAIADGDDSAFGRLTAEAGRRAAELGLTPLEPVARSAAEADALLAARPDAVLVVHPGEAPATPDGEPGTRLWNFLRDGSELRLCDPAASAATPPPPPPPRWYVGPAALLLVDLIPPGVPLGADHRTSYERRERECRAFASLHGLRVSTVSISALDEGGTVHRPTPTVIVHPEITAPDDGTPDGLLWRWLREGRVIHSGRWEEADLSPRFLGGQVTLGNQAAGGFAHTVGTQQHATYYGVELAADRTPESEPARELLRERLSRLSASIDSYSGDSYDGDSEALYLSSRRSHRSSSPPGGPGPRDTTRPLPHDGLFIRRNNAFGTRSVLGAKDLIEQGVIIGQDQIRFDDFVAARTDQVPGPGPGEAVAVSHGLAAVPGEFKADEATTHFVEITLKAGAARPGDAPGGEPLPVNFVFVVDISGSMAGEKLDTVKSALQTIYRELRPEDCLGIITFDHNVRTVLPAVAKKDLPEDRFSAVVAGLTPQGATDINLGVQYGIDEISRNSRNGRTVNCLYLFSDGDPTSGELDWIRIRTNIAARMRGDLTLSCFGFGSDARMPELAALAGLSGGNSTFVTRPEQVGADLLGDLSRRDHLAAIDIQLRLDIDPGVEIRHLYGHDLITDPRARAAVHRAAKRAAGLARENYGAEALPDIITEEKGVRIFAPDLAFEETYWVVLEVRVPPGRELSDLGTATVQYVDTVAGEGRRHEIDLAAALTLSEETVTVHAVGLWTSEVTFYALDDLYDRDREAARDRLLRHLQALEAAHSHLPAKEFKDDQVTLRKFMTLAETLGTMVSFSDASHSPGFAPAVRTMNDFGRMRSGFWPQH